MRSPRGQVCIEKGKENDSVPGYANNKRFRRKGGE